METDLKKIYNNIFEVPAGKKKSNFLRYFYFCKEADFKKKIDTLYDEYYATVGNYMYDAEIYSAVTRDAVSKYTSNKDALIVAYKKFNQHLKEEYGIEITIDYPPIPVSNSFERLMFIAKFLQDKNHKVSDLPYILWQSSRTIEADLAKLQGNDGDPLQVCGKEFVIKEMDRSMGRVDFGSTAHPFFLTCNLTQVITILEGLREMSQRLEYMGYAMPMAKNIWDQMSEYGKKRIFYVADNLLNQDLEWYRSLDNNDKSSYHTERECSAFGDNVLMDCLKNGDKRSCVIEYGDESTTEFMEDVRVISRDNAGWKVNVSGVERILEHNKIIKSSYHKENMY